MTSNRSFGSGNRRAGLGATWSEIQRDFREGQVYATLLEQWLLIGARGPLNGRFDQLPLISS